MRKLVVAALVVITGVVVWLLLRGDEPATPAAAPVVAARPDAERPAPRPRKRAADAAEPAPEATPAPPAKTPDVAADVEKDGELVVVDESGAPLAGVTVGFLPMKDPPDAIVQVEFVFEKPGADPIDALLRLGKTFASDASGKVALPKFDGMAVVGARHGGARGTTVVGQGIPVWRLELRPPSKVSALVVDADGRPCGGVPVLFLRSMGAETRPITSAVTREADGVATFDDAERLSSSEDKTALGVALPLAERPSVPVDMKAPPVEPVRIALPPTGRVRCIATEDGGAPVPDGETATLRVFRPEPNGMRFLLMDLSDPEETPARTKDGAAVFPYVGLGLDLEIELGAKDSGLRSVKQRFRGPTAAGEEIVVRVALGGRRLGFVGRLVDKNHAPIPRFELVGGVVEPGKEADFGGRTAATTDDGGRFRFAIDRAPGDASKAKLEIGRHVREEHGAIGDKRIALVDLPASLAAGDTDVGDVVYDEGAALMSGVVVDDGGKPVVGATVRAMEMPKLGSRSPVDDVDAVTTDDEGRFTLKGAVPGKSVNLGVSHPGLYVPGSLTFPVGSADARVQMAAAGAIAGSIKLPAGKDAREISVIVGGAVQWNGDTDYRFHGEGLRANCDESGLFEIDTLKPGKAKVSLRMGWNTDDTFLVVDDVVVVAGQVTRDPRLQNVDPAASMSGFVVVVGDVDKHPVADAVVSYRATGKTGVWRRCEGDRGTARAVYRLMTRPDRGETAGVDVVVVAAGYASVRLSGVTKDTAVVLEPRKPAKVTVRLAESTPLPDPPFQIAASLHWIEPGSADDAWDFGDPRDLANGFEKFGKDRAITFQTYDRGRYRVDLMLWEMNMSGGGGGGLATAPKTVAVTVGDDGAPAEVVVAADPQALAEAMTRRKK